jgi:LCP family protein required for cell wall assembly
VFDSPPPSPDPPQFAGQEPENGPREGHRRPKPRRRWLRALAWLSGGLAVIVLITSVGGYLVYRYYNGRIDHVQLVFQHPRPTPAVPGSENFLLVGADADREGLGTGDFGSTHSDTTILAHLDRNGTTTLLSFPRDMMVTIPSYTDATGSHPAHQAKINEAIQDGGASLLIETIEGLANIKIDHYIQINLAGFRQLSDAVGGVSVCLKAASTKYYEADGRISTNLDDEESGFVGHVGENTLEGANALAFVRTRKSLPNYDIDRIKRQQVFLGALLRKTLSAGVLLNPLKLVPLLNTATSVLKVGSGTDTGDLRKFALRIRGLDPAKVFFQTVKTRDPTAADGGYQDSDGLWVMPGLGAVQIYDQAALAAQLLPLRDLETPKPSGTPTPTLPLTVDPAQISVTVKNGTTRPTLATDTANALAAEGFQVGPPQDASTNTITQTTISYGAGQEEAARTLQAAIPGSTLTSDATLGPTLTLTLGSDFSSVHSVVVHGRTASPPSPTPTPSTSTSPAPPDTNAQTAGTCTNPIY